MPYQNIKLIIEYDGTNYCGWQTQKNGPSIQLKIEKALKKILREKVKLISSSRTDSGVHAKGQAANFKTSSKIPLRKIKSALNGILPEDISIAGICRVNRKFNSQFDAKSKLYRYTVFTRESMSPFLKRYALHVPCYVDIEKMRKAAKALIGKHDFSSFKGSQGSTKTSIRTIHKINIKKTKDAILVDIEGDGFLYNMARIIAGTLIEVGRGKRGPNTMKTLLAAKNRAKAGPTAPAKGLVLIKVKY